jgi:hypothetical protein
VCTPSATANELTGLGPARGAEMAGTAGRGMW